MNKKNIYLTLSLLSFLLLVIVMFTNGTKITLFEMEFAVIWIPVWILSLFLPLLILAELAIHRDEISKRLIIALVLTIVNMFYIIRYFGFQFFPE
jgi:cytochrome bd-type quinol oxidase subunit 2